MNGSLVAAVGKSAVLREAKVKTHCRLLPMIIRHRVSDCQSIGGWSCVIGGTPSLVAQLGTRPASRPLNKNFQILIQICYGMSASQVFHFGFRWWSISKLVWFSCVWLLFIDCSCLVGPKLNTANAITTRQAQSQWHKQVNEESLSPWHQDHQLQILSLHALETENNLRQIRTRFGIMWRMNYSKGWSLFGPKPPWRKGNFCMLTSWRVANWR